MRTPLFSILDFGLWIDDPDSQTGQEDERAKTYNRTKRILFVIELTYALAFLFVLLVSGASAALAHRLEIFTTNIWLTVFLYVLVVGVAYDVIAVPLEYYGGFVHEHRYGQSTQTFWAWARDQLKSKVVGFAIAVPLIEALYWLLRTYPHRWWLIAGVLFIAFAVLMANIAPVVLMPIFYKFIPLRDEELKKRLLALCERVDTRVRGVYEMDMSRKTRAANAALVGLGNTRRIVLGDTLLERYEPDEIEAVLAHELGHHTNWDMWKGLLFQSAISMLGFFVASVVLNAYGTSFGLHGPADIASFPLVVLTCSGVALLLLPVSNAFSRRLERHADSFALKTTGDPDAFVSMMLKLGKQNLSEFEPNPVVEFILYSHPSVKRRIAHARQMFPAYDGNAAEG